MVSAQIKDVKVVLKLAKGSQTIPGCNQVASNDQLYALGSAVGTLTAEAVDGISKVEETMLVDEA